MPVNKTILKSAQFWAKQHGMTTHDAFTDPTFRKRWDYFVRHPNDKTAQKVLGIKRNVRREGEQEQEMFRKRANISRQLKVAEDLAWAA